MTVVDHSSSSSAVDEIKSHCAQLCSDDFATDSAPYVWLCECSAFCRVLGRFREYDLSVLDVAAALAPDSKRPFAKAAVRILDEELAVDDFCSALLAEC
jgi:hypothetical protein